MKARRMMCDKHLWHHASIKYTCGMKECTSLGANMKHCNCTYEPCPRKGRCCECILYHRRAGELPACYFPDNVERTYDRSIARFIACQKR